MKGLVNELMEVVKERGVSGAIEVLLSAIAMAEVELMHTERGAKIPAAKKVLEAAHAICWLLEREVERVLKEEKGVREVGTP